MNERVTLAKEKEAFIRQRFEAGDSPVTVKQLLGEKFGSGLCNRKLYRIHREVTGKPIRTRKSRMSKRKKSGQKRSVPKQAVTSLVPVELPRSLVPAGPSSPAVDSLLRTLVQAMRAEGVDSLTIRADGGGRIYHVIERDIDVTGG